MNDHSLWIRNRKPVKNHYLARRQKLVVKNILILIKCMNRVHK